MMSARSAPDRSRRENRRDLPDAGRWHCSFGLSFLRLSRGRAFAGIFARNELAAEQLADRRFRDFVDEDDTPRPLEIGKARGAAMLIELPFCDRRGALDEGGDDFAPTLVWETHDRNFGYRGVQR